MRFTVFIMGQFVLSKKLHLWLFNLKGLGHFVNLVKSMVGLFESSHLLLHFCRVVNMDSLHVRLNFFFIRYLVWIKHNFKLIVIIILLFLLFSWCLLHFFHCIFHLVCWIYKLKVFHHILYDLIIFGAFGFLRIWTILWLCSIWSIFISGLLTFLCCCLFGLVFFFRLVVIFFTRWLSFFFFSFFFFWFFRFRNSFFSSHSCKFFSLSFLHIF